MKTFLTTVCFLSQTCLNFFPCLLFLLPSHNHSSAATTSQPNLSQTNTHTTTTTTTMTWPRFLALSIHHFRAELATCERDIARTRNRLGGWPAAVDLELRDVAEELRLERLCLLRVIAGLELCESSACSRTTLPTYLEISFSLCVIPTGVVLTGSFFVFRLR